MCRKTIFETVNENCKVYSKGVLGLLNETKNSLNFKYEIFQYTDNSIQIFNNHNEENQSVSINENILYNTNSDLVIVCFNLVNQDEDENKIITNKKFKNVHYVLTIIGLTASLSGLTFLVSVYAMYPVLRNLHGKDLLCLSSTYIFVYLIMIASMVLSKYIETSFDASQSALNDSESKLNGMKVILFSQVISYVLAVLLHYSFLCTFSWITIISFDICNKLRDGDHFILMRVNNRTDENYIFKVHLLFGYLVLPFLPVCIGLMLDIFNKDSKYAPEYGGKANNFNFWISNRISLFVLFTIPVSIMLFVNLIFFLVTLYFIVKADHSLYNMRMLVSVHKSRNSRILLFIKLLTIMGVCWLLGLLAGLFDKDWLFLLYTICNEFQGFFIFLSFTFNKKVLKLLKRSISPFFF